VSVAGDESDRDAARREVTGGDGLPAPEGPATGEPPQAPAGQQVEAVVECGAAEQHGGVRGNDCRAGGAVITTVGGEPIARRRLETAVASLNPSLTRIRTRAFREPVK
jgi:hypothetical protein